MRKQGTLRGVVLTCAKPGGRWPDILDLISLPMSVSGVFELFSIHCYSLCQPSSMLARSSSWSCLSMLCWESTCLGTQMGSWLLRITHMQTSWILGERFWFCCVFSPLITGMKSFRWGVLPCSSCLCQNVENCNVQHALEINIWNCNWVNKGIMYDPYLQWADVVCKTQAESIAPGNLTVMAIVLVSS